MQYRQTAVVVRFTFGFAKMHVSRRSMLICFVACFIATGCGKEKPASTVNGKVTLAGQPLEEGAITFFSSTGSAGTSEIGAGGTYSLKGPNKEEGVVPGRYTAIVMPSMAQIKKAHNDPRVRVKDSSVPIKYTSAASSPLKYDVAVGPNTIDIVLDSK